MPDAFFVLLGQTVAAAGLVELRVYELVTSLECVEHHVHAGALVGKMVRRCDALLRGGGFRQEFATKVDESLREVEDAMERRNRMVHNVWTFTRDGRIHGWRPAPVGKRDQLVSRTPGVEMAEYGFAGRDWTEHDLRSLFHTLAQLQDELSRLRDESEWSRIT